MAKNRRVGPDVDLAAEDVRDSKGRRIDDEYVARAIQYDPRQVRRGRRSLTGGEAHSPRVSFRVPADLLERAETVAEQEGVTLSALAREALERYLAS